MNKAKDADKVMNESKLHPECIKCLVDKHLYKHSDATEKDRIAYMQAVLTVLASAEPFKSAPEIVAKIEAVGREFFGSDGDFGEIKHHFNTLMQKHEREILERISCSENPLETALKYSVLGNYIDFGALDSVDEETLSEILSDTSRIKLETGEYKNLINDLEKSKHLVFLTDNCGEIVLDKLFLQRIKEYCPSLEITVIVRGSQVLNDATIEDARSIGLTEQFSVIGNGSDVAGTALSEISDDARTAIDCADIIIAKGQGNFETLCGCGKNVYYLFLCKCEMFAKRFGVEKFTGMLLNDKRM